MESTLVLPSTEANTLPKVHDSAWIQNEIDHFVLAKLEAQLSLHHAPIATLIKRLNYDLIGLPPTPKEVSEFINDKSPKAYDSLVERLLLHLISVNAGEGTGLTRHATPIAMDTKKTDHE